jgi:hypothetical protein
VPDLLQELRVAANTETAAIGFHGLTLPGRAGGDLISLKIPERLEVKVRP